MKKSTRFNIFVIIIGFFVGLIDNTIMTYTERSLLFLVFMLFWGIATIIEVLEDVKNKL